MRFWYLLHQQAARLRWDWDCAAQSQWCTVSTESLLLVYTNLELRGARKFCQRGSNFDVVCCFFVRFLGLIGVGGGGSKYYYKRAIIGPPVQHHLNGLLLACRWWPNIECWLGRFFHGIQTSIAMKPYIFVIFQRGSGSTVPPPLWIRAC